MNIDNKISRTDIEIEKAEEQINKLKVKKAQLVARRNRERNREQSRETERERKARAHRLIVIGAEVEKALGIELSEAEAKALAEILQAQIKVAHKHNTDFVTVIKQKASKYVTK